MLLIVCYDVNTETRAGQRRLRRVAKACEGVGQRVQKSVFEFRVDMAQMEALERRLLDLIDPASDSLRLYRMADTPGLRGARAWPLQGDGLRRAAGPVKPGLREPQASPATAAVRAAGWATPDKRLPRAKPLTDARPLRLPATFAIQAPKCVCRPAFARAESRAPVGARVG